MAKLDTQAIITVRIIKSFPYRNVKNYVIHGIDLTTTTVNSLKEQVIEMIQKTGAYRPYRNVNYDTLKIYTKAHGSKTMNLVINMNDDEDTLLIDGDKLLKDCGIENETELSLFNMDDYLKFKENPEEKW